MITEISDVNNHSDRTGMRIYIELKRDAIPMVVLNKLYKHTALQSTFGVNMVALVDGVPRTLSLQADARTTTSTTSARWSPAAPSSSSTSAEKRAHVLEGYLIALDHLDEVIALIRAAEDTETARARS